MEKPVAIVGAGLAGSEAALQLASRGIPVALYEMRPERPTDVHRTDACAELVCSNSLKSTKRESAAGMLKAELDALGSRLYAAALRHAVPAGGALAVDRNAFAQDVTEQIEAEPRIDLRRQEVKGLQELASASSAVILATGPLTSDALAQEISGIVGGPALAFYDAAAPIVMADSLDHSVLFRQSRYEEAADGEGNSRGDYLNAPFSKDEYERFVDELLAADRVMARDFESKDLFQACQPIEEIARAGRDAPRFGPMKPVGLTDPRTGRRPWAALQLRAEDAQGSCYNLVGFQTNLKFGEQARVFRMIPGLEHAEFARYGVMHRNTFLDAPRLLDPSLRLRGPAESALPAPAFVAGQLGGTEGYCEAIRSGLHAALSVAALLGGAALPPVPRETAFGALLAHATDPETVDYQPMHVNFGVLPPLDPPIRNKRERYAAYAARGEEALAAYRSSLEQAGLMGGR
ncbi:MAG: methylenetetrahydrofolate--tRNA-(uracil(54)-C(5))-methyltransferase (FADH(2)-oxidizing) TrmFO [Eggerthellaceae bacterium]|nr:methylenetetrahydrofolate--tRNA-(uracil(54)-C(5))-methyltransferase (FADH(2)-oxidizing) TrmFO [Eggerthellaceae bacterium]